MRMSGPIAAGVLILAAGLPAPAVAGDGDVKPCRYEDGSGQTKCVWDGRHMGNGIGRSVIVKHGGTPQAEVKRITHRRAHKLATTRA